MGIAGDVGAEMLSAGTKKRTLYCKRAFFGLVGWGWGMWVEWCQL